MKVEELSENWENKVKEIRLELGGSEDARVNVENILKNKKITREVLAKSLLEILRLGLSLNDKLLEIKIAEDDCKAEQNLHLNTIASFNKSLKIVNENVIKKFEHQESVLAKMEHQINQRVESCFTIFKKTSENLQDHVTELKKIENKPRVLDWSKINFVEPIKNVVKKTIRTDREMSEKSKNVMIFGIKLDPMNQSYDTLEHYVDNIRSELDFEKSDIISWHSVGSRNDLTMSVRVVLRDRRLVNEAIKRSCVFRQFGAHFENVYITPDRTFEQLKMRRKLVDQLKLKIKEYPKIHWVIKNGKVESNGAFKSLRLQHEDSKDNNI